MKKILLLAGIFLSLLAYTNEIQAQTTKTKLDQLKLSQQLVGTWQHDVGKDSIQILEVQHYGNVFTQNVFLVVNGKKSLWQITTSGYSLKDDKFNIFMLYPSGNYQTWIGSFTAENKISFDLVQNFNPEKVIRKAVNIFETPTEMTVTFFGTDGAIRGEFKWHKIK